MAKKRDYSGLFTPRYFCKKDGDQYLGVLITHPRHRFKLKPVDGTKLKSGEK